MTSVVTESEREVHVETLTEAAALETQIDYLYLRCEHLVGCVDVNCQVLVEERERSPDFEILGEHVFHPVD